MGPVNASWKQPDASLFRHGSCLSTRARPTKSDQRPSQLGDAAILYRYIYIYTHTHIVFCAVPDVISSSFLVLIVLYF